MALLDLGILSLLAVGSTAGLEFVEALTELLLLLLRDVRVADAGLCRERSVNTRRARTEATEGCSAGSSTPTRSPVHARSRVE